MTIINSNMESSNVNLENIDICILWKKGLVAVLLSI